MPSVAPVPSVPSPFVPIPRFLCDARLFSWAFLVHEGTRVEACLHRTVSVPALSLPFIPLMQNLLQCTKAFAIIPDYRHLSLGIPVSFSYPPVLPPVTQPFSFSKNYTAVSYSINARNTGPNFHSVVGTRFLSVF